MTKADADEIAAEFGLKKLTNDMPDVIWAGHFNVLPPYTDGKWFHKQSQGYIFSYTRTDLLEQREAYLQRQRDMLLHIMSGGKFTHSELTDAGLGVGIQIEFDRWIEQRAKVAAEEISELQANGLPLEMEELTAIIIAALKGETK